MWILWKFFLGKNAKNRDFTPDLERKEEYLVKNRQGSRFVETFVT
jgi:hypothetical protein